MEKINGMNPGAETPDPLPQQRLRGIYPLRLKKLLSTLIVLALMAMVLAPTASARLVVTPHVNGRDRSTTVSWANSNWTQVRASLTVYYIAGTTLVTFDTHSSWQPFTARTQTVRIGITANSMHWGSHSP